MDLDLLRQLSTDGTHPTPPATGVPGKSSMTSRLVPPSVVVVNHGGGEPLREDLRARFEGSLGTDLGDVRVHTGAPSAAASDALDAHAYTVGNDIHFGSGAYQPDDPFGLHLLAHEVAHTQQQRGGEPVRQHKLEVAGAGDVAEREADHAADAMVAGRPATVTPVGADAVMRKPREYDPNEGMPDWLRTDAGEDDDGFEVAPLPGPGDSPEIEPPAPRYWGGISAEAVSLEAPPDAASFSPQFDPVRAPWWPAQCDAFRAVASSASGQLGDVAAKVTEYKTFSAQAEQASAGFVHDDPSVGLDNVTVEGSDVKLGHIFKDGAAPVGKDKLGTGKLERADRIEIKKLREQLPGATAKVNVTQHQVTDASSGILTAVADIAMAKNDLKATDNDEQNAELSIAADEAEAEKGRITGVIDGIKSLTSVCMAAAKGKEGLDDLIGGAFDFASAAVSTQYDQKINSIRKQSSALTLANAKLARTNAGIAYQNALRGLPAAITALEEANNEYKTAITERKAIYDDLSLKVEAVVKANGGSAADAAKAQAAVQAVPMIEEVIGRLVAIAGAAAPPGGDDQARSGYAMCTNADGFHTVIARLAGYHAAATAVQGTWQQRLTAASSIVNGMK
jgi:hypothetical protein